MSKYKKLKPVACFVRPPRPESELWIVATPHTPTQNTKHKTHKNTAHGNRRTDARGIGQDDIIKALSPQNCGMDTRTFPSIQRDEQTPDTLVPAQWSPFHFLSLFHEHDEASDEALSSFVAP